MLHLLPRQSKIMKLNLLSGDKKRDTKNHNLCETIGGSVMRLGLLVYSLLTCALQFSVNVFPLVELQMFPLGMHKCQFLYRWILLHYAHQRNLSEVVCEFLFDSDVRNVGILIGIGKLLMETVND